MKTTYCIVFLCAALLSLSACGGDDDNDLRPDNGSVVIDDAGEWEVPYSLKAKLGVSSTSKSYSIVGDTLVMPVFTSSDVAKPLVMTVTGTRVSGSLRLLDTDGTFAGTLTVKGKIPVETKLTGKIAIPSGSGVASSSSRVSLAELVENCGHTYTAEFQYGNSGIVELKDDKAYFQFIMSPLQHRLDVNAKEYAMNDDGIVWIAVQANNPLVTNFYKKPYNDVEPGKVYVVDRSGFVDLGIINTLWADKNVGASRYEGYGSYKSWDMAMLVLNDPLELPLGGNDGRNDFKQLHDLCDWVWGEYNGVSGYYVFKRGCSDVSDSPHIFLPAAGRSVPGGNLEGNGNGFYWTSTLNEKSAYSSYNLYFTADGVYPTEYYYRNVQSSMRAIMHSNSSGSPTGKVDNGNNGSGDEDWEYVPPYFPFEQYDISKVVAWYSHRDYYEKEDSWRFVSLFLFSDGVFVSTINKCRVSDDVMMAIVELTGKYEVTSDKENVDYANATFKANVTEMNNIETFVSVVDGVCEIFGVQEIFKKEPDENIREDIFEH